jgi:hypothetical protein
MNDSDTDGNQTGTLLKQAAMLRPFGAWAWPSAGAGKPILLRLFVRDAPPSYDRVPGTPM